MQGDPEPLIQAVNRLTTLARLGLDLHSLGVDGQDGPGVADDVVIQLRLPALMDLTLHLVGVRVDARACPLLKACGQRRPPVGFRPYSGCTTWPFLERFPTDTVLDYLANSGFWDTESFLRDVLEPALRRYPPCREDGIQFGKAGFWRRMDSYDVFGREYPHWQWTAAAAAADSV